MSTHVLILLARYVVISELLFYHMSTHVLILLARYVVMGQKIPTPFEVYLGWEMVTGLVICCLPILILAHYQLGKSLRRKRFPNFGGREWILTEKVHRLTLENKMSGEKKIETSEASAPTAKSVLPTKLPEKDMGKEGIPSDSVPSASSGANDRQLTSKQGVYYPPTSCYDYYYPGQNGNSAQFDDKGSINTPGDSYGDVEQHNASHLYYIPGIATYSTGFVGVDEKQVYTSAEYIQAPCSYGSEAFPCYTYDSTYAGNGSSSSKSGSVKSAGTSGYANSNGFNVAKANGKHPSKTSASPFYSKSHQSNISRSIYQNQSFNPLNKFGAGFQSSGLMRGNRPAGNYSSLASRNPHHLKTNFPQYGAYSYQPNARPWNNNYKSKSRQNFGRSGENNATTELTRGPRADNRNNSTKLPTEVEQLGFTVVRDKYNLQEFETVYDNAKFFIIKSYSEDDIHKCIKYDVWSSTPNGNRKLDAAFLEADAITRETDKACPVFLFFSVNASGQFVGVAEMVGQVDFTKNMDFWQLDKWNGFFPLKWHIIKDVPNPQLRHIILENNDNRDVTYSRDTQEIGLKQGLEMLIIFKNYSPITCVLDDFNFYEGREKALKAKRARAAAAFRPNGGESEDPSLVALTEKLSLEPTQP